MTSLLTRLSILGRWLATPYSQPYQTSMRQRWETAGEALEPRQLLSTSPALNLLFFGNSFTYNTSNGSQYDMPATLKAIAVADGFTAPNVYEQILLGESLADHLNTIAAAGSGNIISSSLPTGQSWSDVVLQEYSTRPTNATSLEGNVPLFRSDALQLFNEVRANSPQVAGVLYETWARGAANSVYPTNFSSPTDMQNQLQTNYNLAAGDINTADGAGSAIVSPVGEAWRDLNWESSLYSTVAADGVQYHPNTQGTLLNAMVLFDTIYHTSVSGISLANVGGILTNLGLTTSTWTALAAAAASVASSSDTTPPTASLTSAPALASTGTAPYSFNVTYSDNVAVSAGTLGNSNLLVTGPNGYSAPATLTSTGLSNGSSVTATYSVPAPASGWSTASNGTYTIALQSNQVADASGNFAAAGKFGSFSVNIPASGGGSLSASQAVAASKYNLTTLGTSDWEHWGTGNVVSNVDRKISGNSQISNVTRLGSGNYGSYYDPTRSVSWTDGTPLASDSGDDAYIWANNAINAGYSFTVPANTSTQTLYVYAGGYSSGATLTAHLSDGSAADFVATASGNSLYTDIYAITFKAASAGQTLTISYVKTANINGLGGSADLIAAALVGAPVKATTPPTASIASAASITASGSAAYTFSITYSDNIAVNAGTLGNSNLLVTGPNGYSQSATLISTGLSNAASVTATYSVPAPSGGWSSASNGTYTIALQSNQVDDTSGNFAVAGNLDSFSVNIPAPGSGALVASQAIAASKFNLTTLGTTDWIHWGTGNNAANVDRKASGNSQISNVTKVGSANYGSYYDTTRSVSWTDGAPQTVNTGDDGYIWANNVLGGGYSFTVPAGTATHTLYIYAGGYSSGSTLRVHLSDSSAPDYVATASGNGLYTNLYTITFNAASANQTLTISFTKSTNINGIGGSADLIAAALA